MTAGANLTAASEGDSGGNGSIWRAHSAVVVPIIFGIIALVGWWQSGTSPSIALVELVAGLAFFALALFIQFTGKIVGNRRDYFGGLVLIGMGLFALWAAKDLPGMHGFAFGPGTAPHGFAIILAAIGVALAMVGLFATQRVDVERFAIRGPLLVTISIFVFAASIRPLGLVITTFVSIMVSAAATEEVRWVETAIWAVVLTVFCCLLFPIGLNLPLQMWPNGLDPMQLFR